jgi:hypothetical protein
LLARIAAKVGNRASLPGAPAARVSTPPPAPVSASNHTRTALDGTELTPLRTHSLARARLPNCRSTSSLRSHRKIALTFRRSPVRGAPKRAAPSHERRLHARSRGEETRAPAVSVSIVSVYMLSSAAAFFCPPRTSAVGRRNARGASSISSISRDQLRAAQLERGSHRPTRTGKGGLISIMGNDTHAIMLQARELWSAMCVQSFDGSRGFAIRNL